jgi:hypothetical protein
MMQLRKKMAEYSSISQTSTNIFGGIAGSVQSSQFQQTSQVHTEMPKYPYILITTLLSLCTTRDCS